MQPFLPPDEATAIHKYLAHITATRSNVVTKQWFLDNMVLLGLKHGITFLSTIETTFPPLTEAGRAELRGRPRGCTPSDPKNHQAKRTQPSLAKQDSIWPERSRAPML
jgi:hypothetical protein